MSVILYKDLLPNVDSTLDIGADATRWLNIYSDTLNATTITDGTLTITGGDLTTAGTAFLGLIDLGTNTIDDTAMTGDWDFNSGNVSNIGTLGAGATTVTSLDAGSGTIETTGAIEGDTIDATTDFTVGDTVITDGVITDATGLSIAAVTDVDAAFSATTVDADTDFTVGDTVITDGAITDATGLSLATNLKVTGTSDLEGYVSIGNATALNDDQTLIIDRDFTIDNAQSGYQTHISGEFTKAGFGTSHPLIAGLAIEGVSVTGVGTISSGTAALYIDGDIVPNPGKTDYALWVNSGMSRFGSATNTASFGLPQIPDTLGSFNEATTNVAVRGFVALGEYAGSVARTQASFGLNGFFYYSGNGNFTTTAQPGAVGGRYALRVVSTGNTINIGGGAAALCQILNTASGATVTDGYAFKAEGNIVAEAASEITTSYNFWGQDPGTEVGTIVNDWGLYQEELTGAGTTTQVEFGTSGAGIYACRVAKGTQPTEYMNSDDADHLDLHATTSIDMNADMDISTNDIITDTSTGTKIATATNQKLGFYNATPVVQQTGCAVPIDLATAITAITALRTALNNLGFTTVV